MSQQINKQLVRQRFANRLQSYSDHAVVQQQMAQALAEMIARHGERRAFSRLLEVGAGSGAFMAELLQRFTVESYYANDLVEESLLCLSNQLDRFAREGFAINGVTINDFHFLPGDIEQLETLPSELDLVASNATLQWLEHLESFFARMAQHLNPDGMLAFSSFSTANMHEIAEIAGTRLHYHSLDELEHLASNYFDVIESKEEMRQLIFSSPEAVLHHIRQTGVNGISQRTWTKSHYQRFIAQYRERFSCPNGVTLTYHPLYCCMKKRTL